MYLKGIETKGGRGNPPFFFSLRFREAKRKGRKMNIPGMVYFTVFHPLTAVFNWKKSTTLNLTKYPYRAIKWLLKTLRIKKMFEINGATSILVGGYGVKMTIYLIY